uniref:Uncharacterized protein n=1 Tax=Minutocellus polymorphus TaxID=265543 RepID=A0A7S0AC36_9STRA|mmetsp:Transcript_1009/g.1751  ORF Transcript_1009/g.1751 Transcript_1009/m.1751 type:complete len:142 (+) Transcript_1009:75-500(+)
MPRSTATPLAFATLLLSDLTLPSHAFAPSGVIANNKKCSPSSSLSMVFLSPQTRSGGGGGGGKRKHPSNPQASSLTARSSVASNSLSVSEATSARRRSKIDTSNFGVSDDSHDTVRHAIRNDVYQKSLQRLLCDGEEECLF